MFIKFRGQLCGGDKRKSLRALVAGWITMINELLHRVRRRFETMASESQKHISPPTTVASVLTIRPWPIPKTDLLQPNGTTQPTTASRPEWEVSPLWCLHLALALYIILYGGDTSQFQPICQLRGLCSVRVMFVAGKWWLDRCGLQVVSRFK